MFHQIDSAYTHILGSSMAFICLFLSLFVCLIILYNIIPHLRRKLLDYPNERSSHVTPTPSGGGISFVCITVTVSLICFLFEPVWGVMAIPIIAFPLALVGLADDFISIKIALRLLIQVATSALLIFSSPLLIIIKPLREDVFWGDLHLVSLFLLLIAGVVAVINFTNFMDGIDGLVGGVMLIVLLSIAAKSSTNYPLWALVGSLLGFIRFNWFPAKVFMGDVGSTFLGAVYAALIVHSSSLSEVLSTLLLSITLLADALTCICRRLINNQSIFTPHRDHLFQRLHQAGWSHSQVSTLYMLSTFIMSSAFLLSDISILLLLAIIVIVVGIGLDRFIAVPFKRTQ